MELMHGCSWRACGPTTSTWRTRWPAREHFRTTVQTGIEIMEALRGWTSGLAVPHFVIDAPGGGGKIPLLPEYVESMTDDEVVLRNFEGERYVYRQPREEPEVIEIEEAAEAGAKRKTA